MPILKNKIFIYLSTRYLTYGLQFILSLIIAVKLGPYYLGVYGMVQLILSYFAQVNFGIPHSLNVFLVHNKDNHEVQNTMSLNSFTLYTYMNIVIVIIAVIISFTGILSWGDYQLGKYFPLIIVIAVLTYYNTLLSTIIRFRNRVNLLSIIGSVPVLLNLAATLCFEEERLVYALTIANLISCLIVTIIGAYTKTYPQFKVQDIAVSTQKVILRKGLYLFLYNSCFYFILISVRTIISSNYTVEEFGYFTFSYTIANAVMLLLDSLNTIIFPKSIDILSGNDKTQIQMALNKLRVGYITSSHLLVYVAMICFPFFITLFPKYEPTLTSMNMISLAILMNTNCYGYNTMLIAQNREDLASYNSMAALVVTIIGGLILVEVFSVGFSFVIVSMLLAYLVFSFMATYQSDKIITGSGRLKYTLMHFFPLRLFIPYLIAATIAVLELTYLVFLPLVLFLAFNYKDLTYLKGLMNKMIKNPNVIDV